MKKTYFYLDMKTHELDVPYSKKKRRIRVLLPKDYEQKIEKYYPVVYMHDGQNVFYSREAYVGHSWKVIPTLKRNADMPDMIVVAIDNDGENRMNEYAPWIFSNIPFPFKLGGGGKEYSEFIMDIVKPFIDTHYRTKVDKNHTAMIGSSLGANITQYMGLKYKDYIGRLGIFSSANWLNGEEFSNFIKKYSLDDSFKVYIQVGTKEGDDTDKTLMSGNVKQAYVDTSLEYYKQLIEAGLSISNIKFDIVVDGIHHEEVWAKYLPECLKFICSDWE